MDIALIFAATIDGVIGVNNTIPWHLPDDMKRFKQLTTGSAVIMGKNTYHSMGKPLPNRRNIIVTSTPDEFANIEGVETVDSVHYAMDMVSNEEKIFFIGGSKIYADGLFYASKIYFTKVMGAVLPAGDRIKLSHETQCSIVNNFHIISRDLPDPTADVYAEYYVLEKNKKIIDGFDTNNILRKIR